MGRNSRSNELLLSIHCVKLYFCFYLLTRGHSNTVFCDTFLPNDKFVNWSMVKFHPILVYLNNVNLTIEFTNSSLGTKLSHLSWPINSNFYGRFYQNLRENWVSEMPSFGIILACLETTAKKIFFFRNKTFLFFKIGNWNFQHLFKNECCETTQNFNLISQPREKKCNNNCLNKLYELKLC